VDEDGGRGTPWAQIDATAVAVVGGVRPTATYRVYQTWELPDGKTVVVEAKGVRGDAGAVKVTAVEGRRIAGRVLLPQGVEWWNVRAQRDAATRDAETGDEGEFTIDGLVEGTWTLEVYAQTPAGQWRTTVPVEAGASGVVLEPQAPR
jgi:hypothetical protein